MNFYAYCNANPLNFTDIYGLCPSQGWDWLKQGGVNLLQGLQDTVFDLGNFALTGNNPANMLALILNGPLLESPQWAKDKYVGQSDFEYGASKFLTSQGFLLLLGAGEAQLLKGMAKTFPEGSFSILDWTGYPKEMPRPGGPFRLLDGAEYDAARKAANTENNALHKANECLGGLHIHEIQPVKFGGSPNDLSNKFVLTPSEHRMLTNWWNQLLRDLNGGAK